MKQSTVACTLLLTLLITFPGISSASGNDTLTQSSPTFMQQLSSCGQRLKKLAKFAVMTSLMFSPEVAGHSITKPTTPLPSPLVTPFSGLTAAAVHPTMPEVALAANNIISFVNTDDPNSPVKVPLGEDDYNHIINMAYDPTGTLLAIASCAQAPCSPNHLAFMNHATKTIQTTYQTGNVIIPLSFDTEGTTFVGRGVNSSGSPIDLILDIPSNQASVIPDPASPRYLSRLFDGNTFIMNGVQNIETWNLDEPLQKKELNISSPNNAIFGSNEKQIAYFVPGISDSIFLQNGPNITCVPLDKNIATILSYCPELKQFLFTTGSYGSSNAYAVYSLDPESAQTKELYDLSSQFSKFNYPAFSPDGCKLFVFMGQQGQSTKFGYIDFTQK